MSELVTIDDAFAAALDDSEETPISFDVEDAGEEVFGDTLDEQATEESEADAQDETEELFGDLELDGVESEEEPLTRIDIEGMTFDLPGFEEPVTFQELRDGYLRQADYTRKTQTLAEQRKTNERAIKLYEAIQADPMAVARQIAEEVGLIQGDAQPTKAVEFSVFQTQEAVEAEIQKRVEEAVSKHPAVIEANEQRAKSWLSSEFDRIESTHGVQLGPKSRQKILQIASDRGVTDLELVFNALMAQKQSRSENARLVAQAAPGRPGGRGGKERVHVEDIDSIEQAFAMADAGA